MKEAEILEAKRKLYLLLLEKPHNEITDNEADIMFALCQDDQIQELLRKKI